MTATKAEKSPFTRNPESIRIWGASWTDLNDTARKAGSARATLAGDAAESLNNYLRCEKCRQPVPVIWGDLTGTDLAHALTAAIKARLRQNCKEGHTPVLVGTENASQGRTEPQEAAPVLVAANSAPAATVAQLRESAPGVVTASELAGPVAVFRAGPEIDCLHENFRGVKGVCPDCKQWVGGKR